MGTTWFRQTRAKSEAWVHTLSRTKSPANRCPSSTRLTAYAREGSDAMSTRAFAVMRMCVWQLADCARVIVAIVQCPCNGNVAPFYTHTVARPRRVPRQRATSRRPVTHAHTHTHTHTHTLPAGVN
eukprot:4670673-Prymnesium_polylepis.2